jgi:Protein of unknown function (DUF551)
MNGWIKCSDRLPDNKDIVLVINKYGEMAVCRTNKNSLDYIFMLNDTSHQIKDITHWMPLPAPPETGNNE